MAETCTGKPAIASGPSSAMRILIAALGSHGDLLPFIGIGQVLHARGHDVRLYSNGHFADLVRGSGLDFVETSDAQLLRDAFADPRALRTRQGMQLIAEGVAASLLPTYDAMQRDCIAGQTLLVGSTLAFGAHLLAETDRLPFAAVHLSPSIFRSVHDLPRLFARGGWQGLPPALVRALFAASDRFFLDPLYADPLNAVRRQLGLDPVRQVMGDWLHQADVTVGLYPRWFAPPPPDAPHNLVLTGFPLHDRAHGSATADGPRPLLGADPDPDPDPDPDLRAWSAAGDAPRVVFTAGTANTQSEAFYATSARACANLGLRGALVASRREQLPAHLPPGVVHVRYAPFSRLFTRADLAVHHGGIGTLSQGLAAGVPQLIRPMAFDQFDNARRACRLGVASELLPSDYRLPALQQRLRQMLNDDALRARCTAIAQRLAPERGLMAACDVLEAVAERRLGSGDRALQPGDGTVQVPQKV